FLTTTTSPTGIYPLSLHDALPIYRCRAIKRVRATRRPRTGSSPNGDLRAAAREVGACATGCRSTGGLIKKIRMLVNHVLPLSSCEVHENDPLFPPRQVGLEGRLRPRPRASD